jgi:hypothetical protein
MKEEKKKTLSKKKLVVSLIVFIVSYVLFLMVWMHVETHYAKGLLYAASKSSAFVKNIDFEMIHVKNGSNLVAQFLIKYKKGLRINFNIDFSMITFNTPLTFAIMAAFSLYITNRKRAYLEALLLLFVIHFLHVFSNETGRLSYIMTRNNIESASEIKLFFWQYLWGFLDSMVIRYEPFLIGFYLYFRFSNKKIARDK